MASTIIRNGRLIDGTGNPWRYADVAITGDRIREITPPGTLDTSGSSMVIDATDHVIAPGFIDIQSHSLVPFTHDRRALSKVTQGVTTEILGEDWTPAPFGGRIESPWDNALAHRIGEEAAAEWEEIGRTWRRFGNWLDEFERRGLSVNIGSFLGGGSVREYGMGREMGDASPDAISEMKRITSESMEDGAFGIATALIYPPNAYSSTGELIEVMRVVAAYDGVHITHMRSEGDEMEAGWAETLRIATETGVASEIYHLKAIGQQNWHKIPWIIDQINSARAEGIDIGADMYPYEGAGTGLSACIPPWAQADGKRNENLRDPETRARILDEMSRPGKDWENFGLGTGAENIILAQFTHPDLLRYTGWRLSEVASDLGLDWKEAILHLLEQNGRDIFTMYLAMSTDNLQLQAQQPWMKWGTDAGGTDPEWGRKLGLVHPRAYGSYPRILGRFVRENGWITLEDAVRKGSSAVARRLGIYDRGIIAPGMRADVIVFDPETVIDHASYTDPHKLSTGIRDVLVNGTPVLHDGAHTDATPGTVVRGPGYRR